MDFTLTDDQQLLRDTARKLLDQRVPARGRARAHRRPAAAYAPLWTHLSEYTALGLGPATDLCLFLEETGKVAAPGPFLATPRCSHHSPARKRPAPSPSPARAVRGTRTTTRSRRSSSKPTASTASRSSAPAPPSPSSTRPPASALRFVKTVDFSRRIFELDTDAVALEPATTPAEGARGVARPRLRVARGRDGRHRASHLHDDARVREGTQAVRRADRQLPGDPAQARRDVTRARAGDGRGALRGDERRRRRRDPRPAPATSPRRPPALPPAASSRTASRSTAASATRGNTTSTSSSGAPPPTSTSSAPPAGTTTASPTSSSTAANDKRTRSHERALCARVRGRVAGCAAQRRFAGQAWVVGTRHEIVTWLDELDPDVVCLQEIWQDDRHPNTGAGSPSMPRATGIGSSVGSRPRPGQRSGPIRRFALGPRS